jgi:hypothetical protein
VSLDLASIRAGIAQTLSAIPEIVRVERYAVQNTAANNLPCAMLFRESFQGPDIHQADIQLGSFDANLVWTIRVYANLQSVGDAQEFHDTLTTRLTSAFTGNMLIDPSGPGAVDESRITYISPIMQEEDHPALWITEATLKTFSTFTP